MLTVGSLFSGIGGIDLGLERAGMKVLWQVELSPFCRAVLEKHWPDVERFEDVRSVGARELPRVDLIAGGFPCQDLSYAGKGAGITEGTRSGLWFEFARIIRELRPRYVLVENVPALRSRGLHVVLGDLAACGYDAEWDCIPAAAVGAPHRRDRIWLLAYPHADDTGLERRDGGILQERAGEQPLGPLGPLADTEGIAEWAGLRPSEPATVGWRRLGYFGGATDSWLVEPNVGRVADGVPSRVDRLTALGNAAVPQVVEWIGRQIVMRQQ